MEDKIEFKGQWVPSDMFGKKSVGWTARIIFLKIHSFKENDKDCYVSNAHLAELMGISETRISKHIKKLIDIGWVEWAGFDGRKRYLRSCLQIKFKAKS